LGIYFWNWLKQQETWIEQNLGPKTELALKKTAKK
jgi:hypothetical protein